METKSLTSSRTSEKEKKNVKIGFQFSFGQAAAFDLNIKQKKKRNFVLLANWLPAIKKLLKTCC
jgi:hypothetical protein